MENNQEKIFAEGFIFKRSEKAPDFVVGNLSLRVDEAITFLKNNDKNGWVNLSIKKARSGNYYLELDTFEPSKQSQTKTKSAPTKNTKEEDVAPPIDDEELPF